MDTCMIRAEEFAKHPKDEGVYVKHFFSSADNDRLNNLEVKIQPGCQISPHIHDNSTEFYYVVSGTGEFLVNNQYIQVQKGDALKAPLGQEHGFKNNSGEELVLFSTFSPPIK